MDKFFVGTLEGSGTHLLLWLLESHPMIKKNRGLMNLRTLPPKDPPAPPDRIVWVTLDWLWKQKFKKVILLTRTPVNAIYSAYRRFWTPKKGTKEEVALLHLKRHLRSLKLMVDMKFAFPTCDITYENLTMNTQEELKKIAGFIGLSPATWKYDISKTQEWFGFSGIRNRNREGWKQDKSFCEVWEKHKGLFNE